MESSQQMINTTTTTTTTKHLSIFYSFKGVLAMIKNEKTVTIYRNDFPETWTYIVQAFNFLTEKKAKKIIRYIVTDNRTKNIMFEVAADRIDFEAMEDKNYWKNCNKIFPKFKGEYKRLKIQSKMKGIKL